jgi:transcription elongation factor S-II
MTPTSPTAKNGLTVQRSAKVDGVAFPSLGDKTRDACRSLIYDALAVDSGARTSQLVKGNVSCV